MDPTTRDYGAVLFDMDGTLIDSIPAVERSWLRWCGEYGVHPARLDGFHGIPAAQVIAGLLPQARRSEALRRIRELEVGDTEGITVLAGAAEALAALAGAGAKVAVVTSCTTDLADARVLATGLAQPDVVVTASDVARGKPHPDPYLRAAELLGVDPGDCLAVEDAVSGLRSARAAGCAATLAVSTTTPAVELAAVADLVVERLDRVVFAVEDDRIRVRLPAGADRS